MGTLISSQGPGVQGIVHAESTQGFKTDIASFCGDGGGVVVVVLIELSVCSIDSIVSQSKHESGDAIRYPIITMT